MRNGWSRLRAGLRQLFNRDTASPITLIVLGLLLRIFRWWQDADFVVDKLRRHGFAELPLVKPIADNYAEMVATLGLVWLAYVLLVRRAEATAKPLKWLAASIAFAAAIATAFALGQSAPSDELIMKMAKPIVGVTFVAPNRLRFQVEGFGLDRFASTRKLSILCRPHDRSADFVKGAHESTGTFPIPGLRTVDLVMTAEFMQKSRELRGTECRPALLPFDDELPTNEHITRRVELIGQVYRLEIK